MEHSTGISLILMNPSGFIPSGLQVAELPSQQLFILINMKTKPSQDSSIVLIMREFSSLEMSCSSLLGGGTQSRTLQERVLELQADGTQMVKSVITSCLPRRITVFSPMPLSTFSMDGTPGFSWIKC
jgi:hypothetical protein